MQLDKRATSADGYEMNFATNTLGSFAVARLLMPALERAQGRVIFVSSGGA